MIDGIRRRRPGGSIQHPADREAASRIVVGDHSKDTFQPPQEISAREETRAETSTAGALLPEQQSKKQRRSFKQWWTDLSKKQKIVFWVVTVVLVAGLAVGSYCLFFRKSAAPAKTPAVSKKQEVKEPPKPTTEASKLTGIQVDPSVNQRPVTAVMIENSEWARPQSGLEQAGVVFEAIAEGGITRFLTLFQDSAPGYIGPVRSVRPYYIQWLMGFDASVAHVGGSAEALQDIKTWGVKDLDQFFNSAYYHRIASREAPHNVYTSMDELNQLEAKKGFGASNYTGFPRKAEQPSKNPNVRGIDFRISSALFNVHYDYDPATNSYKRMEGGAPHMAVDQNGNQTQITPKVVVAIVVQQGIAADDLHTSYGAIGSGRAFVFQDGLLADQVTWRKNSNAEQITFTDQSGNPVKFNPGQTWISVVGSADRVTYR